MHTNTPRHTCTNEYSETGEILIRSMTCINVSTLLIILHYNFRGCDQGGNCVKGMWDITVLFLTNTCEFYNYLNKNFSLFIYLFLSDGRTEARGPSLGC